MTVFCLCLVSCCFTLFLWLQNTSPLLCAYGNDKLDVVRFMIERGAKFNIYNDVRLWRGNGR